MILPQQRIKLHREMFQLFSLELLIAIILT